MGKRKGGYRRKTRKLMRKDTGTKGKISLADWFATYKQGDKVSLCAEPGVQDGIYNLRFHGKVGTIVGQQGRCYHVAIMDGDKAKTVIVHPVHLHLQRTMGAAKTVSATMMGKQALKSPAPKAAAVAKAPAASKPALKPVAPATKKV